MDPNQVAPPAGFQLDRPNTNGLPPGFQLDTLTARQMGIPGSGEGVTQQPAVDPNARPEWSPDPKTPQEFAARVGNTWAARSTRIGDEVKGLVHDVGTAVPHVANEAAAHPLSTAYQGAAGLVTGTVGLGASIPGGLAGLGGLSTAPATDKLMQHYVTKPGENATEWVGKHLGLDLPGPKEAAQKALNIIPSVIEHGGNIIGEVTDPRLGALAKGIAYALPIAYEKGI